MTEEKIITVNHGSKHNGVREGGVIVLSRVQQKRTMRRVNSSFTVARKEEAAINEDLDGILEAWNE